MKWIDDFKHDVKNVQDNVLADLNADERVRMFLKAAGEDQDERIDMLRDTAPKKEYRMPDLEFTEGAREAYRLSSLANSQLERLYTSVMMHEAGRDKLAALVLLNEALGRLSQDHFTVDEYGNAETPDSWPHDYGPVYDADTSRLAGKYRELWEQNDLNLAFDPEDRSRPYFVELAAGGLLGYRSEITENYTPAGVARAETKLIETVAEFYTCFHTWRRLAEDHLGVSLDELLQATQPDRLPFDEFTGPGWLTEDECRELLERMQLYVDAHEESIQKVGEAVAGQASEDLDDVDSDEFREWCTGYNLDDMIESHVKELVSHLNYV